MDNLMDELEIVICFFILPRFVRYVYVYYQIMLFANLP